MGGRRLSEKGKECLFFTGVGIGLALFLFLAGDNWCYEYSDSFQYMSLKGAQGVMPIYPLFIALHRKWLGEDLFLDGVVFSQTILTWICVCGFAVWVRKRFSAGYLVTILAAAVSLVPFLLDFPMTLVNHSILTEALAYPFFYLFIIVYTEAIIRKKVLWMCPLMILSLILALIRTQMQICFLFSASALLWMIWIRRRKKNVFAVSLGILSGIIFCVVFISVGELVMLKLNGWLWENGEMLVSGRYKTVYERNDESEKVASDKAVKNDPNGEQKTSTYQEQRNVTGQFDSVLMGRALYEMDEEDEQLFEDPELRMLYLCFFDSANELGLRYTFSGSGLWKWRDIMNGVAGGVYIVGNGWNAFLEERPDSALKLDWTGTNRKIAFALLRKHWPRALYHALCMLPSGFICTVFFQKESFYGLCHFYTLFLYLCSITLVIYGFRTGKISQKRCEFMLVVLVLNVGMVVVISLVFVSMQRYLIYGFGAFYTAYLLMLESLWMNCGRKLWEKRK